MPPFASPNIHKAFIYCSVIDQYFVLEKRLAVIVFGIPQYYSTGKSLQIEIHSIDYRGDKISSIGQSFSCMDNGSMPYLTLPADLRSLPDFASASTDA